MRRRTLLASIGSIPAAFALRHVTRARAQPVTTLDRIRETKVMRLGVTPAEPWYYRSAGTGGWAGIGVQLGQRLASDLDADLALVETTWANAITALQTSQIDLMLVMDPTPERLKVIDFPSAPLLYYAIGALTRTDFGGRTWTDLDTPERRIGVTLGTSVDEAVSSHFKAAAINRYSNNDEAVDAFVAGKVDVVAQYHPALVVQFARIRTGRVILPAPVHPVATSAGVRREADPAFRNWLDGRFSDFYANGLPEALFRYYLREHAIDPDGVPGLVKEAWS